MEFFNTIFLGIIEGITEFLPVSSTAHLLITGQFLSFDDSLFQGTFSIAIQSGAMLAVLILYFKEIFSKEYFLKICVSFFTTSVIGLLTYPFIHKVFYESFLLIAIALIIGGFLIIFSEEDKRSGADVREENISWKQSIYIGLAQSLAIIPGVSRSLATIYGGIFSGLSRKTAVMFSFLLAVPTIFSASVYDIYKQSISLEGGLGLIILGAFVSFIVAFVVVKWFLSYIQMKGMKVFGWYRIVLGIMILFFLVYRVF